ncbi:hypothetical protein P9112_001570 [Eukaryota sp. TZLM1-RC]
MSKLKFEVRKGDVRERISCYLGGFFQAKSRASGLKMPDSTLMIRFATNIFLLGLQKFLISRIRDEVFPDFPTLVNTAKDQLHDCTRVASWNRSLKTASGNTDSVHQAGMKFRSSHTCRKLTDGTCFKCYQKGHLARHCPSNVKHEVNHLHHVPQYLTNRISS